MGIDEELRVLRMRTYSEGRHQMVGVSSGHCFQYDDGTIKVILSLDETYSFHK
jgi:hypothetical protein